MGADLRTDLFPKSPAIPPYPALSTVFKTYLSPEYRGKPIFSSTQVPGQDPLWYSYFSLPTFPLSSFTLSLLIRGDQHPV
jgi:hypothetical protein